MSNVTTIKKAEPVITMPDKFTSKYTQEDIKGVQKIVDWINDETVDQTTYRKKRTLALLGRRAHINDSTLQSVVSGKYPSPVTGHIAKTLDAMSRADEREQDNIGNLFVETSVFKFAEAACHRAHINRNFSVISAYVGTGKTTAVKEYANRHPDTVILIEGTPDMNASVLISELVSITGAVVHKTHKHANGTKADKMAGLIRALKGTDKLLIIDEAETLCTQALEYVRRISDLCEIGAVLSGTEKLKPLIKDPQGRFGQISSRVGFWPNVIKGITQKDARELTEAAFEDDDVELTDDLHDAFWQVCQGSARILVRNLIPGVRDYGLKKDMTLSRNLIFMIGQDLLGFRPTRNGGK